MYTRRVPRAFSAMAMRVACGTPAEVFSQPEKLCGIGLAVPQATRIAMALKARGIALPESIYTYEQLKAALLELKGVDIC